MSEATVMRCARRGLVVHAASILRVTVMIDGGAAVFFGEELFDFPIALFGANAEFEVFAGNGVPVLKVEVISEDCRTNLGILVGGVYLVDHHDGEEVADCGKE